MKDIAMKLSVYATVETDVSFKNMTTLRIGGNASIVVYPSDLMALEQIMKIIDEYHVPYKIFGKGSNILCSDKDYKGVIIRFDRCLDKYYIDDDMIIAQAGCSIIALSYMAMNRSLSGLEWASGIPGTLGGCIFMNAGAYKSSIKDVIKEVFVYKDNQFVWMKNDECDFAYRHSIFQDRKDILILGAKLQLTNGNKDEIRALMENRKERRMASQPLNYPSAGSVFRNPENHQAWSLIDGIGYRGKQIGGAQVSEKHVNFIINKDNATGTDFLELVSDIKVKVKDKYGIELHMEVEKFNWE